MDRLEALEVARDSMQAEWGSLSERQVGSPAWNELRAALDVLDEMIEELENEDE